MMRGTLLKLIILGAIVSLAGCATQPISHPNSDQQRLHKAALINAQLGIDYLRSGNRQRAYEKLKLALSQYPDSSTVNYAYALMMQNFGENAKAKLYYEKALQLDPKNSDAHNNFGVFLCQQKQYAEAQTQFKAAVTNPLYATPQVAYANSGFCYLQQGNQTAAEKAFRKALVASPNFRPALYGLIKLATDEGDWKKANSYLKQASSQVIDWPPLLGLCIEVKRHVGDISGATQCARTLYRQYPDSPEAKKLLDGGA